MVTIKKSCLIRDRVILIIELLTTLNSDLRPLTIGEREIILSSIDLPVVLRGRAFGLAAKRYFSQSLNKSLAEINRLIGQLFAKGYLEVHYGEYFYKPGIWNLISLAQDNKDMVIQLNLLYKEAEKIEKEETATDVNEEAHGLIKGDLEDI